MGVINFIYICILLLQPSGCKICQQSSAVKGLQMWYCITQLWHNLQLCNLGVLCKSQTESHLNHHYYFPSAWRLVPDGGNFCKTFSIVLTLCGKIYETLCENYHATLTFLPTDQSFQSMDFADLAWCKNLNAEQTGWESLMNNKYWTVGYLN